MSVVVLNSDPRSLKVPRNIGRSQGQDEHPDTQVLVRRHSRLIEDNKSAHIGPNMTSPGGAQVLDYTDEIDSLGFIDTDHYLGQTQLKGQTRQSVSH